MPSADDFSVTCSFWYPTWLAQPAALAPDSKLIDAPPHGVSLSEVAAQARDFDLAVVQPGRSRP
ncbi:MAG: hypothetical protein WAN05_01045 [Roseiarcus sp.]